MQRRAKASNLEVWKVRKEADQYLDEIAANYNYTLIQIAEKFLTWVWNNLFDGIIKSINQFSDEGGSSIKLFTIGFGSDADKDILQRIADPTGGKQYDATPDNINKIYEEIATFF